MAAYGTVASRLSIGAAALVLCCATLRCVDDNGTVVVNNGDGGGAFGLEAGSFADANVAADGGADVFISPDGSLATDGGIADGGSCVDPLLGVLFCDDFDHGSFATNGWVQQLTGTSTVSLVASTRSAPYAFESRLDISSPAQTAIELHSVAVPASFSKLRIGFDVRVNQRDNAQVPADLAVFRYGAGYVGLFSNGATQVYGDSKAPDGGRALLVDYETTPTQVWMRFDFEITRAANGDTSALVRRDGVPYSVDDAAPGTTMPIEPLASGSASLELGGYSGGPNGMCVFDFDNVTVSYEP